MLKKTHQILKKFFRPKNHSKLKTFCLYVPPPPKRDTIYREKSFDKIIYEYLNQGHELISIKTVTNQSSSGGFWALLTVKTINGKNHHINLNYPLHDPVLPSENFEQSDKTEESTNIELEFQKN